MNVWRTLLVAVFLLASPIAGCSDDSGSGSSDTGDSGRGDATIDQGRDVGQDPVQDPGQDPTVDPTVDPVDDGAVEDLGDDSTTGDLGDDSTIGDDVGGSDVGGEDVSNDAAADVSADASIDAEIDVSVDAEIDVSVDVALDGPTGTAPVLDTFAAQASANPDIIILYIEGTDAEEDIDGFIIDTFGLDETTPGPQLGRVPGDGVTELIYHDGGGAFFAQTVVYWAPGNAALIGRYDITAVDLEGLVSNTLTTNTVNPVGAESDDCVRPSVANARPCGFDLVCGVTGDEIDGTCRAANGNAPALNEARYVSIDADAEDCSVDFPHQPIFALGGFNDEGIGEYLLESIAFLASAVDDPDTFAISTDTLCVSEAFLSNFNHVAVRDLAGRDSNLLPLDFGATEVGVGESCGVLGDDSIAVCEPDLGCEGGTCTDTSRHGSCDLPIQMNRLADDDSLYVWEDLYDGAAPVFPGTQGVAFTDGEFVPSCAFLSGGTAGGELTYRFQAPVAGTYLMTTLIPGAIVYGDTLLSLWDACDGTNGNELACNEDLSASNFLSAFEIDLEPFQTVYLTTEPWASDGNSQASSLGVGLSVPNQDSGSDCHVPYATCDFEGDNLGCIYDGREFVGACGDAGAPPTLTSITATSAVDDCDPASDCGVACPDSSDLEFVDIVTFDLEGTADIDVAVPGAVWFSAAGGIYFEADSAVTRDGEDYSMTATLCVPDGVDGTGFPFGAEEAYGVIDAFGEIGSVPGLSSVIGADGTVNFRGRLSGVELVTVPAP